MQKLKKIMALVMTAALICVSGLAVYADGGSTLTEDKSKSKSATNLDSAYKSNVTLSLPSAEEQLTTDVVFVLDKSTSAEVESQITAMLSSLQEQVQSTGAKVQVGVVIFNKEAHVKAGLTDISTPEGLAKVNDAIATEISSGTNLHAGLLAGKAMLDGDTETAESRKYLITVSDGITYMYNEEPTVTAWSFNNPNAAEDWHGPGSWQTFAGPDNWYSKYHTNDGPEDWNNWMEGISEKVAAQETTYEYLYGGTIETATDENINNWDTAYAMSIDKALYLSYETYQAAKESGYHCYALTAESEAAADHPWGSSFMNFLAGGKSVDFTAIQNDILYLIDHGTVTDYIGKTDDYNFDMVDQDQMVLKVGKDSYNAVADGENHWTFADGKYEVTYYPETEGTEEYFEWNIKTPVSNLAPVSLTYTVQLTNPKTEPGTYGQYDEYGEKGYAGLYTNNSAELTYYSTGSETGVTEEFNKPTVSYTVEDKTPVTPPVVNYYGNLTVSKTVAGEGADTNREFQFTVILNNAFISGTYGDVTFVNGKAEFTLKHGETKIIRGLRSGTGYTVIEIATEDYTTEAVNAAGAIPYSSTAAVTFTNTKNTAAEPEDPDEPDTPVTPEEPGQPEDPDKPDTPDTPDKPVSPDTPDTPDQNETTPVNTDAPQTGDTTSLTMWILLLVTAAGAASAAALLHKKQKS